MLIMIGLEVLVEIKKSDIIKNIFVILFFIVFVILKLVKIFGVKDYLFKFNNFNELKDVLREII